MSKIKINEVNRRILFYNKFKYSTMIKCYFIHFLDSAKSYTDFELQVDKHNKTSYYHITDNKKTNKVLYAFLRSNECKEQCKIRIDSYYGLSIYTNDLDVLTNLSNSLKEKLMVQEAKSSPPKTIYFKDQPKYTNRVYLKHMSINDEDFNQIYDTLSELANDEKIKLSPSLSHYLNKRKECNNSPNRRWASYVSKNIYDTHFIDYTDDEKMITYLHLVLPPMFGKQFKLEKRPG